MGSPGNSLVDKELAVQVGGPEFGSLDPRKCQEGPVACKQSVTWEVKIEGIFWSSWLARLAKLTNSASS